MGNNLKSIRVHATRHIERMPSFRLETECGTIGRTIAEDGVTYRTALGNPFRVGIGDDLTCLACRRWVKIRP